MIDFDYQIWPGLIVLFIPILIDGEEFLRILDVSGYLDTEFNWIGDIPLTDSIPGATYRAFRTTIGLGYSEIEVQDLADPKRYKGSYLISRFNPHRDQYEYFQLAKVYYTDPKERPNRTSPQNFQVKLVGQTVGQKGCVTN